MSFLCVVLKCKEINWEEKWWKDSCWDGCSFLLFLDFDENLGTSAENINRITTVLHNLDGLDISSLKIRFWNLKNVSQGIDFEITETILLIWIKITKSCDFSEGNVILQWIFSSVSHPLTSLRMNIKNKYILLLFTR